MSGILDYHRNIAAFLQDKFKEMLEIRGVSCLGTLRDFPGGSLVQGVDNEGVSKGMCLIT